MTSEDMLDTNDKKNIELIKDSSYKNINYK